MRLEGGRRGCQFTEARLPEFAPWASGFIRRRREKTVLPARRP
ncbi:hypothetical protein B005_0814 [Nocardiopsis alba ATCC BAA-2165]|uniref:Uncharacterized protein n=1 Tax=Nocardiopsis alba (strain ATCC BAA-2165 / BE74) TaxID=1205910 RepID=J7L7L2_NOCAA|nr:hypothetical protein B005_0814 [Nocardiopsis alba ATCC BAA-2165]